RPSSTRKVLNAFSPAGKLAIFIVQPERSWPLNNSTHSSLSGSITETDSVEHPADNTKAPTKAKDIAGNKHFGSDINRPYFFNEKLLIKSCLTESVVLLGFTGLTIMVSKAILAPLAFTVKKWVVVMLFAVVTLFVGVNAILCNKSRVLA